MACRFTLQYRTTDRQALNLQGDPHQEELARDLPQSTADANQLRRTHILATFPLLDQNPATDQAALTTTTWTGIHHHPHALAPPRTRSITPTDFLRTTKWLRPGLQRKGEDTSVVRLMSATPTCAACRRLPRLWPPQELRLLVLGCAGWRRAVVAVAMIRAYRLISCRMRTEVIRFAALRIRLLRLRLLLFQLRCRVLRRVLGMRRAKGRVVVGRICGKATSFEPLSSRFRTRSNFSCCFYFCALHLERLWYLAVPATTAPTTILLNNTFPFKIHRRVYSVD